MAVRHPAEAPTEGVASELHSIVRTATATAPGNPRGRRVGCIIARCLRMHAEKSPDLSTRGVVVERRENHLFSVVAFGRRCCVARFRD